MRQVKVLTMVLAGGVGERLYPLTANRSKPAVPFGGNFKIIDFVLMNCVLSGIRRIHVLTQYHSQSLGRHQRERWNFLSSELGEYIDLVPPKLRSTMGFYHGTADAIYRNLDLLDRHRPDVVLVLSGDHIYRADYHRFLEFHVNRDADVSVLTGSVPAREAGSFGVLRAGPGGEIREFVEKPPDPSPYACDGECLINLGVYCFQTRFLVEQLVADSKKKTAHDFGKNILPGSLGRGTLLSCPLEAVCPDPRPYWRDVGTIDSYFQSTMDLLDSPPAFSLRDPRWGPGSKFLDWLPARVSSSVLGDARSAGGYNLVASGCEITAASLVRSVLSPGVRIGQGSEIHESILLPGVEIGEDVHLNRVVVEEGVHIPPGTRIGFGDDAKHFVTSPGGVVVVSASYRFEPPAQSAAALHDSSRQRSGRSQAVADRVTA